MAGDDAVLAFAREAGRGGQRDDFVGIDPQHPRADLSRGEIHDQAAARLGLSDAWIDFSIASRLVEETERIDHRHGIERLGLKTGGRRAAPASP